jgi:signal transduction histidine kinase
MLVQNLAVTYKCYSSIGNSLDLKEMIHEVLRNFVSETYASYAQYSIEENKKLKELTSFGKIENFDINNYNEYNESINTIDENTRRIVIIRLEYGSIALVTESIGEDCSFFISMFESFIKKLNVSIMSCLNVQKLQEANILLENQKRELINANKAKDDFLANMSHELKTPLNSINVISTVMQKNKDNNLSRKQIKNLEIINKCGNELLYLVNDVLDLSKLEANEISLNNEHIDIHEFITNIFQSILPQTKAKDLYLELDIEPEITTIYSDEKKINQIIKNLLSNAIKFTSKGKIKLNVKDSNDNISIIVSDEGIGIPEEKLAHIFDRFKQVDASTSRQYGGTGLGLAISKELSLLLKGNITIQSTLNVGTSFELSIPKKVSNDNKEIEVFNENEIKEVDINQNKTQEKENILIFNSDPIFFFSITMKLGKKYNVFQVNNIEEFFATYKENSISKTIIDFTTISKEVLEKIDIKEKKYIVAIFDDKILNNHFINESNVILKIKKTDMNNKLNDI